MISKSIPMSGKISMFYDLVNSFPRLVESGKEATKTKSFFEFWGEDLLDDKVGGIITQ